MDNFALVTTMEPWNIWEVKVEIQIAVYKNVDNTDFGVLEKNHKM